jgi:putative transposase
MPSNKTITPLSAGKYYHIFNRGINKNLIFFRPENYIYFLSLWKKYLMDYTQVLSYCLLPNHFHLLVKLADKIVLKDGKSEDYEVIEDENKIGEIISEKLRRLFISYSQAINRQENRSGSLFTRNFKRIELEDDEHLKYLFFYIHYNPYKHGLINDFKDYRYSSFKAYISSKPTYISKEIGFEIFGGKDDFLAYHNYYHEEKENLILE